jgi:hypothetical protein
MSRLLAEAYERTTSPGWLGAQQACDAVCVLVREYGHIGPRRTARTLAMLSASQDTGAALDCLAELEAHAWDSRDPGESLITDACRAARVELMASSEETAPRFESVKPEAMADTQRSAP